MGTGEIILSGDQSDAGKCVDVHLKSPCQGSNSPTEGTMSGSNGLIQLGLQSLADGIRIYLLAKDIYSLFRRELYVAC